MANCVRIKYEIKCNRLIQKYSNDETVEKVFVFAIVFNGAKNMELIKTFQRNIHDRSSKVTVNCMSLTDLIREACYKKPWYKILEGTKDMIQSLVSYLETKFSPHPCVILFDEVQLGYTDLLFFPKSNWSNLRTKTMTHIVFCFSPMQKYIGRYLHVKLDSSFYTKTFKRRYRNSERIQELAIYLSKMNRRFQNSLTLESEENVPCLQGQQILWIDVGDNFDCIEKAVEKLKNMAKFPKEENILLHDDLSDDILTKVEAAWPDYRTRKNVKEYIGCECDSLIYISTGAGFTVLETYFRECLFVLMVCLLGFKFC